jgi:tripeptidyl-peptidase-1
MFAPAASTVHAVKSWLLSAGIAEDRISQSANKQWMQFDGKIHELEGLLYTDYHVFENKKTNLESVACEK